MLLHRYSPLPTLSTFVSISNIRRLRYDGNVVAEDLSDSLICSGPQTL
jgi:hypothetical protein